MEQKNWLEILESIKLVLNDPDQHKLNLTLAYCTIYQDESDPEFRYAAVGVLDKNKGLDIEQYDSIIQPPNSMQLGSSQIALRSSSTNTDNTNNPTQQKDFLHTLIALYQLSKISFTEMTESIKTKKVY